ncbi:hypothetical protein BV22DRAFT_244718 [Leucogyrophana mollusca]|uniref:Uncharacterized protein n=1 Tax=Leucogyrophana mollusca TaxID=85980 RepID=A0ACB8BRG2_9AGAM|nr:hypothetical protein BV22DRAFT_244718 [Leucogyrophana mollusca]
MWDPSSSPDRDATVPVLQGVAVQAQEQIDQELETLARRMRALRAQRNTFSPISTLPPGLLETIFMYSSCPPHPNYHRRIYVDTHTPWVWTTVTHVCRHWRQVALSRPSLWTTLTFTPAWSEAMLARSKMGPLVIDVDLTNKGPKVINAVSKALKHAARVRELRLVASKEIIEGLTRPLTTAAPALESLALLNTLAVGNSDPAGTGFLPVTLFSGGTPRLRRVEMLGCAIAWSSPLLAGLVELDISYLAVSRPTVTEFITTLSRMPALRTLSLEDALPLLPSTATASSIATKGSVPQVNLPTLTRLHLAGSVLECAHLLAHLNYPANAALSLKCKGPGTFETNFPCLLPYVSSIGGGTDVDNSSSSGAEAVTLRSMAICTGPCNGSRVMLIRCSTSDSPPSEVSWPFPDKNHWSDAVQLALEIAWQTPSNLEPISCICHVLPLSNVRSIHVNGRTELPEAFWLDSLSSACALETLTLTGSDVSGLVEVLARDGPEACNGLAGTIQTRTIFAPALTALELEDVEFDGANDVGLGRRGVKPMDLRDALIVRANRGVNIQKLGMSNCHHLCERDAGLLGEVVVDFHWDGVERCDGNSEEGGEEDEDDMFLDGSTGSCDDSDDNASFSLGWSYPGGW